jgi:hypothetical protein
MTWKKNRPDGAGVDGVGEAPELDTVLVRIADQIDQLLDRPAQPVS